MEGLSGLLAGLAGYSVGIWVGFGFGSGGGDLVRLGGLSGFCWRRGDFGYLLHSFNKILTLFICSKFKVHRIFVMSKGMNPRNVKIVNKYTKP